MRKEFLFSVAATAMSGIVAFAPVAQAQSLSNMLNAIDQPQDWTNQGTGPPASTYQATYGQAPQQPKVTFSQPPQQQAVYPPAGAGLAPGPLYQQPGGMAQTTPVYPSPGSGFAPGPMYPAQTTLPPQQMQYQQPMQQAAGYGQGMMMPQGAMAAQPQNPLTLGKIFNTLFGGTPAAPKPQTPKNPLAYLLESGPPEEQAAISQCQAKLATAQDQDASAINDANSVSGESDRGTQQNLASSARYHANAARAAADAAYSVACNSHSSTANDLAAQASAAADEAQSAADRAQSNVKGGW